MIRIDLRARLRGWSSRIFTALSVAVFPAAIPATPAVAQADQAAVALDSEARANVVADLARELRNRYVHPDIGEQAAARIEAALTAGEYDKLASPAEFAARLTQDLAAIAHDKHLRILSSAAPPAPPAGAAPAPMPLSEAGVVRADRLPGDIGYIEVVGFPPASMARPVFDRAMTALAGSKALIFDIRRNRGGTPEAVAYLVSFLMPEGEPVLITDIVARVPETETFDRRSSYAVATPVRFPAVPVYVLTSGTTFSGGEEFAYDLQTRERAVIVGEVTGGGANPTSSARLGEGFMALIPFARAENPITKTNWEGSGIQPDVVTSADSALAIALERLGQQPVADIAAVSRERVFSPRTEPVPGAEAALRGLLEGLIGGSPDYDAMAPAFAEVTRQQLPMIQSRLAELGELHSITYCRVDQMGGDAFDVAFAKGSLRMRIVVGSDGTILGAGIGGDGGQACGPAPAAPES